MMNWNEISSQVRTTPITQANELKFNSKRPIHRSSALLRPGQHNFARDQPPSVMQTPRRQINKSKTWQLRKLIESDSEKEDLVAGRRATLLAQLNESKQPKKLRSQQSRGLKTLVALIQYFLKCLWCAGIIFFPLLATLSYVAEKLHRIFFITERYLKRQHYRYLKRAIYAGEDVSFICIIFIFPFLYFAAVIGLVLEVLGKVALSCNRLSDLLIDTPKAMYLKGTILMYCSQINGFFYSKSKLLYHLNKHLEK